MSMTLRSKLADVLKQGLRDGSSDLEDLPNGRIVGHVISSEFEGLDYENRRKRIRELLNKQVDNGALSEQEVLNISTLLTYTPGEWSVVTADVQE